MRAWMKGRCLFISISKWEYQQSTPSPLSSLGLYLVQGRDGCSILVGFHTHLPRGAKKMKMGWNNRNRRKGEEARGYALVGSWEVGGLAYFWKEKRLIGGNGRM